MTLFFFTVADFVLRECRGEDPSYRAPADFNLWEEEAARQLHLLRSNLIVDRRFRRRANKRDRKWQTVGRKKRPTLYLRESEGYSDGQLMSAGTATARVVTAVSAGIG